MEFGFGLLEMQLAELISDVIGADVAVGRAIVAALSFGRRIDVLVSATKIRAPRFSPDDLETLAARLRDAEERRNRAFHSVFIAVGPEATPVRFKERARQRDGYTIISEKIDATAIRADADFIAVVTADVTRAGYEITPLLGQAK